MADMVPRVAALGDACCGCGACAARCPKSCIEMLADECGFLRPEIDSDACVRCEGCDSVCPVLSERGRDDVVAVEWAKSNDATERECSSPGGVFSLLARAVLEEGGVVVGVAWEPGFKAVSHVLVENKSSLGSVRLSKYVQSALGRDVYEGVRGALRGGMRVLFSGTACQVAGMRSYLGKLADSDRFLAVDVICHGVPSPRLWEMWAEYKEGVADAPLIGVNMRSKATGWLTYSTSYEFSHGSGDVFVDSCRFGDDWYMRAFLSNASLRSSCLECPVKRSCGSDITLGDFWGFQDIHSEVDFSKGISAVICNTEKGAMAVAAIEPQVQSGKATFEQVLAGNPSLIRPAQPYPRRREFLSNVSSGSLIADLMTKWDFKPTLLQRFRGKLSGIKRRIVNAMGLSH